ncbi:MAG TPA: methyltransferase, TIGR04325 family [Methylotenera sp.]|nr:methyltransferase, TIGR04325 family [Methylotenera sp.]
MNKKIIKKFGLLLFPPVIIKAINYFRNQGVKFSGIYPTWEQAQADAKGYEANEILNQIIANTKLVESGKVAYERDGIVFDNLNYNFQLLAVLLRAATENGNTLRVLDFGGSLGSTYYQCRNFLQGIATLKWCVVEQSHFVKEGNKHFANEVLSFHETIAEVMINHQPNLVLFSSVLQYLSEPYLILNEVIKNGPNYIVIDRNPFLQSGGTIISLQKVPKEIVESSYPIWLFNEKEFKDFFINKYSEIATFSALDGTIGQGRLKADFKGIIYKKIEQR